MNDRAIVINGLKSDRTRVAAAHQRGAGGREVARALSDAVDRAVLAMLPPATDRSGFALVALGGYGRREMCPHSDVDLLVLSRRGDRAVERTGTSLFYALWDAGLDLSPVVRTVPEAVALATEDLTALTSSLQSRFLAGDRSLFAGFRSRLLAQARRRDSAPFLKALREEDRRRHLAGGKSMYGLEPDLKEGRGGLRDYHFLLWAGLALAETASLHDLARAGYLAEDEAIEAELAVDHILRVRHHLHFGAGRRVDRLYFEYQEELAAFLGYERANGHLAIEQMMRVLNARFDAVAGAARGFWERTEDRARGPRAFSLPSWPGARRALPLSDRTVEIKGGRLRLVEGSTAPAEPAAALALFVVAARSGANVSHGLITALRGTLANAPAVEAWSPEERAGFLEVVRSGDRAASLLEAMAQAGLLSRYLPEWEDIRYLAHRDVYHQYTVDRHTLSVVRELHRAAAGEGVGGELSQTLAAELVDFDCLLLAGLLHDLGKGRSGDHSVAGADVAGDVARRMGLPTYSAEALRFLVRNHLLLARAATRRDLDDEGFIARVARMVGDADRLRTLYLLTEADSVATGPSAWTEWKAALVRDLTFRALRVLNGGEAEQDGLYGQRMAKRREELRLALAGEGTEAAVDDFLAQMPAAYLWSRSAEAVREHFALVRTAAAGEIGVYLGEAEDGPYQQLTLAAADRPGLLWRVCGVFALHRVNVLEARVYTGARGMALDVFRLSDAIEPRISDEKRERVVADLKAALAGRLSLPYRLARKLKHYRADDKTPARAPRVLVDNHSSAAYTVVEVRARDRLGLLYTVAKALSDLDLDIHLAKVATRGPEAVDAFYVRDSQGRKVEDPAHVEEVRIAVLYELCGAEA